MDHQSYHAFSHDTLFLCLSLIGLSTEYRGLAVGKWTCYFGVAVRTGLNSGKQSSRLNKYHINTFFLIAHNYEANSNQQMMVCLLQALQLALGLFFCHVTQRTGQEVQPELNIPCTDKAVYLSVAC